MASPTTSSVSGWVPRAGLLAFLACGLLPLLSRAAAAPAAAVSLVQAVRVGDAPQWRALLAQKPDVNARDSGGNTALHFAALNHDIDAVRTLLAAGADSKIQNAVDATPLHYGAGHAEIVVALLARGANPNAVSKINGTPLMSALAQPGSWDAVQALVAAGADVRAARDTEQAVMLNRAIVAGDRRSIDLLLSRGAIVNPATGRAPLPFAAVMGDVVTVRALLDRGANLNYDNGLAGHALNWALYGEKPEMARLLIERGANLHLPSSRGHGTPPMVWAAYNQDGNPAVAQALAAASIDVNTASDTGATALGYALHTGGDTPLVQYLRSAGAKEPPTARGRPTPNRPVPADPSARAALIRERVPPAIALLQKSSTAFLENGNVQRANCRSCHQQDVPALTFELARARGFEVDDEQLGRQLTALRASWTSHLEIARQVLREPLADPAVNFGYGFLGLGATRYARDEMTDAMAHYLLRTQRVDGSWASYEYRPPMEDGPLVATAWATLALRDYAPLGRERQAADGLLRTRRWLAAQKPQRHNEAAFQLLGLGWADEDVSQLGPYVDRLMQSQRKDGGWSQLPALESDAWATGTALFALRDAGKIPVNHAAYQRGVEFLLRTQHEDGSWRVRTRVWPFQPHFDGRFPHGKDQWISAAGTAWAAAALLATLEPNATSATAPRAQDLIVAYQKNSVIRKKNKTGEAIIAAPGSSEIVFARDIQPLFKRSCAGCHGGEKPRAAFSVATRDTLLKGGASGDPAISPGYADDSVLIQYVSGKIEDLEMPPLNRREKYPPLTPEEIQLLRTWIDAGASWSPKTAATTSAEALRVAATAAEK